MTMTTQDQKSDQIQMVQDIYTSFLDTFNRSDADAIAKFYTDDAVLLPMNSPMLKGKENIRQFWLEAFNIFTDIALTVQDVEIQGYLLGEYGIFTSKNIAEPQNPQAIAGKYVVAWKNINGYWKLHRDIFNAD